MASTFCCWVGDAFPFLSAGTPFLSVGTPFLSRPSFFRSQELRASLPQLSSQTQSEKLEQGSLALHTCSTWTGRACSSQASVAAGVGATGEAGGLCFRHLRLPRFSISTAVVRVAQHEPQSELGSQSLEEKPSRKGRNTCFHLSASERPLSGASPFSPVAGRGVTSQSLTSASSSPCSSSSSMARLNSDSSIFSMEKVELVLAVLMVRSLAGAFSFTSHASRSFSWPQALWKSNGTRGRVAFSGRKTEAPHIYKDANVDLIHESFKYSSL
ncbi:hypothetical protein MATL_G00186750 [Megalops atlanticus]|uniref:Uncharacterized protein n=1 Tax=Megalops atlanticus TaxID=7932 RepID=A0A9D3T1F6_MEGAT|nr:hypothetical protein MATL_G00186750 [Megalops atlanticus]